jgi:maleylpyruvate isomerase
MAADKTRGRFNVEMNRWPLISAIDKAYGEMDALKKASPIA